MNEKVRAALYKECPDCGARAWEQHSYKGKGICPSRKKRRKEYSERSNNNNTLKFICVDCGIEFDEGDLCEYDARFPDRVCGGCSQDLREGFWAAEKIEYEEPDLLDTQEFFLWEFYGQDPRNGRTRKGSSPDNIAYIKELHRLAGRPDFFDEERVKERQEDPHGRMRFRKR
jgi:hypothetical protein